MKEIVIEISENGDLKLETRGFSGKTCIEESQFVKDLLGNEISRQLTPAYYKQNNQEVRMYLPLCG
jgi:hypothetical protein